MAIESEVRKLAEAGDPEGMSLMALKEFFDAFDPSKDPLLWAKLAAEELGEMEEAFFIYKEDPNEQHIADILKETSDLAYVLTGLRLILEPDHLLGPTERFLDDLDRAAAQAPFCIPLEISTEAFIRVHESNLTKLGDDGKPLRREDGKILKGPNYKAPDLLDLAREFKAREELRDAEAAGSA